MNKRLLNNLKDARWHVALRTFGNDHATLIGLLVDWWISNDPDRHWVVEAGPSSRGEKRGRCDAVFCVDSSAVGVLEVEGTRYNETLEKIGDFFTSEESDLQSLRFGIFLGYPISARGRGKARKVPPLPLDCWERIAKQLTAEHIGKDLVILALEKKWEPKVLGLRTRNQYYKCRPTKIHGVQCRDGRKVDRQTLHEIERIK